MAQSKTKRKWGKPNIRKFFSNWKRVVLFSVILALIVFRLFLPRIVKNYVNKTLNNMKGYHGDVDDIDISLYRGAYIIKGLHLYKDGETKPMLDLERTDISVEWGSLFHGRVVSKITMIRPHINLYVTGNKQPAGQKPKEEDWTSALRKLVPIKINRLTIREGEILYKDFVESPDISLAIHKIELTITNLSNVRDKSKALPSDLSLKGVSFGNGSLTITGKLNAVKDIPDVDLNIALRNSNVTALNSLTMATAGFDFERGQFELFSEIVIKDAYLKGYVKPMFHNIRIPDSLHKANSSFLKRIWEEVITFVGFVLKNKSKDSFATKIPLEGDLKDPHTDIWAMIGNIFRNGFIKPFKSEVDNDIKFDDAHPKKDKN